MSSTCPYVYDPARRIISVDDARLNRMLVRDAHRHATLSEYATGSGLPTERVVELLGPYLDDATLALETAGGEIFILTAPGGRPLPGEGADVAPNLWETLRCTSDVDEACRLWRICRSMQRAGWEMEVVPSRILHGLGPLMTLPKLAVVVGRTIVPLMIGPDVAQVASSSGLATDCERAGMRALGLVCPQGQLDAMVTAARRWLIARRVLPTSMSLVVLEAPRYQPVLLAATDSAVTPRTVDRSVLAAALGPLGA